MNEPVVHAFVWSQFQCIQNVRSEVEDFRLTACCAFIQSRFTSFEINAVNSYRLQANFSRNWKWNRSEKERPQTLLRRSKTTWQVRIVQPPGTLPHSICNSLRGSLSHVTWPEYYESRPPEIYLQRSCYVGWILTAILVPTSGKLSKITDKERTARCADAYMGKTASELNFSANSVVQANIFRQVCRLVNSPSCNCRVKLMSTVELKKVTSSEFP